MTRGYNPYRSHGKFASGPHKKRIAKARASEARHRAASTSARRQMIALKRQARGKSKAVRESLKKRFDRLAAKREKHKARAADAKQRKIAAQKRMRDARAKHREKVRDARAKAKDAKQKARTKSTAKRAAPNNGDQKRVESARPPVNPQPHGGGRGQTHQSASVQSRQPMPPGPEPHRADARAHGPTHELENQENAAWHMREAEDHLAAGRLTGAKASIDRMLAAHGFAQHPETQHSTMLVEQNGELGAGAAAHRKWDGTIVLMQSVADRAHGHGMAVAGGRAGSHDEQYAMRTVFHEAMHGHGPTTKYKYVGMHAAIEEITTESVARKLASHYYGTNKDYGAYGAHIHAATTMIAEHHGVAYGEARRILEETSVKFKKEHAGSDMPFDVFVRHLGPGRLTRDQIWDKLKSDRAIGAML